jgi:hypothetical protein
METASFFDRYPRFRETSHTDTRGHRLDYRYRMLIQGNQDLLRGARVLDLASHDGRWAFAAHTEGAAHVTGVEARPGIVASAEANFAAYGVPADRYELVTADCLTALHSFEPRRFDVVFCFGFLYHTMHHFDLLHTITRLEPRVLIVDSVLIDSKAPAVMIGIDDSTLEGAAVPVVSGNAEVLVGIPTTRALDLMLTHLGWELTYLDWHGAGFVDWTGVEDYRDRKRFSLVARRRSGEAA